MGIAQPPAASGQRVRVGGTVRQSAPRGAEEMGMATERLSARDVAEMQRLVDEAALGDWFVAVVKQSSGLDEYDVFEGDGAEDSDANSMALCYEERVAMFVASAPTFTRWALAHIAALEASNTAAADALSALADDMRAADWYHVPADIQQAVAAVLGDRLSASKRWYAQGSAGKPPAGTP